MTYYLYSRKEVRGFKAQLREYALKAENLSRDYDTYRRKYLDLDDRFGEVKNMEQTYRVAFQEWKSKYEALQASITSPSKPKIEDKTTTPNQGHVQIDEEDNHILFVSWKKKARKLEKYIDKLQLDKERLQDQLADMENKEELIQQMEEQLIQVKKQLKLMSEGLILSPMKKNQSIGKKDQTTSSSSDVFDLSE